MKRVQKLAKSARGIFEPVQNEEDVLGAIRQLLEARGARVFRSIERVPKCYRCGCWLGSSEVGTPDLSGYFVSPGDGHFSVPFWIEVKRPKGGRRRPAQEAFIEARNQDGLIAFFATSIDDVILEMGRFGIKLTSTGTGR